MDNELHGGYSHLAQPTILILCLLSNQINSDHIKLAPTPISPHFMFHVYKDIPHTIHTQLFTFYSSPKSTQQTYVCRTPHQTSPISSSSLIILLQISNISVLLVAINFPNISCECHTYSIWPTFIFGDNLANSSSFPRYNSFSMRPLKLFENSIQLHRIQNWLKSWRLGRVGEIHIYIIGEQLLFKTNRTSFQYLVTLQRRLCQILPLIVGAFTRVLDIC